MSTLNFITADEARIIASDVNKDSIDYEFMKELNVKIKQNAQKGRKILLIDKILNWYCIDFLQTIGYTVIQRVDHCEIRW